MAKRFIAIAAAVAVLLTVVLLIIFLPKAPDTDSNRLLLSEDKTTVYRVGDEFIPPNVVLVYENGETEDVSSSEFLEFSGYNMQQKGSYTVRVRYSRDDVTAATNYQIEVRSDTITDIRVSCEQSSLVWGEKIDRSLVTVRAVFDDGRREKVEDYQLTYNNTPEQYGQINVKVSYKGFEKLFTIEVVGEEIDTRYKTLEDEAKRILIALGVENPSSPKDYTLEFDLKDKAKVKITGDFDDSLTEQEQIFALLTVIFGDYTTDGTIEDTYEMIFPSKKIIFVHEEKQVQATAYVTKLAGKNKYSFIIEEAAVE